ncbi:cytochrome c oxidase assembly protein [Amycolatopsis thermoflava]|uniref:cytochrome c oxidase assembly protein n=1 Tax=Amycolatopsis thermoflava TaxID=84480 RepID=UPI003EB75EE8
MSDPLTWHAVLADWRIPLPGLAVLIAIAAGYLWCARRVRDWPIRHTAWFLAGLVVIAFAIADGLNGYSRILFAMHMVQHLVLIVVAPLCLVLGSPLRLVHASAGERARPWLRRFGRSGPVRVAVHPLTSLAVYTLVVVGTHLTPFQQSALLHPQLHRLEELMYLAAGVLLLLRVIGNEPGAPRLPALPRLVLLFAAMVVDAIAGVALLMSPREPFPAYAAVPRHWGPGPVADIHWGGAIMWVGGDALMAAIAIIVIAQWVRSPDSSQDLGPWLESARRSAVGAEFDEKVSLDEDDEPLRAYNAMLARLASEEASRRRPR